jgi:hypothetical protein
MVDEYEIYVILLCNELLCYGRSEFEHRHLPSNDMRCAMRVHAYTLQVRMLH